MLQERSERCSHKEEEEEEKKVYDSQVVTHSSNCAG